MNSWSEGYLTDVDYIYGYYPHMAPSRFPLAFLDAGLEYPEVKTACEIGFGQGLNVNIHAAASETVWYGTDFSPSQVIFANRLARYSGAHLFDQSFAEFCERDDLPDFDYIALHGIWSWISPKNQQHILNLVRKKLKVGGVVYVSYNASPGWATMRPIRDLMVQYRNTMTAPGKGVIAGINETLDFLDALVKTGPICTRNNQETLARIGSLRGQNRHYLAQEYFDRDWEPVSFFQMSELMASVKCTYACSASYYDHVPLLSLTEEQAELLDKIPDPTLRESVRDIMCNKAFRRDYWVKGRKALSPLRRLELLREQRTLLPFDAELVDRKVSGEQHEVTLSDDICVPLLEALDNHEAWTLGELEQTLSQKGLNLPQILSYVIMLVGKGALLPVQPDSVIAASRPRTGALNNAILDMSRDNDDVKWLASPVSAQGILVPRVSQLFLLARREKPQAPEDWAKFALNLLSEQGRRLAHEGKELGDEESLDELTTQAMAFEEKQLPILQRLGIAD